MRTLSFFLFVSLFPVSVMASFQDCGKFLGNYVSLDARNQNLNISLNATQLILQYNHSDDPLDNRGYTVAFIADGSEHLGTDANTGTSYVASCFSDTISIVRNGLFVAPLTSTFTVIDGILTEVGTVQGFAPREMGKYKLSPQ